MDLDRARHRTRLLSLVAALGLVACADEDPPVEQELGYDDDSFEWMSAPWENEPGGMIAVRFTAPRAGRVVGARLFVTDEGTPDAVFAVRVLGWQDLGGIGFPGEQLGADVEANAGPSGGWVEVDFSDQDIAVDDDFVVAMRWLTPPGTMNGSNAQILGVDTNEPDGRTYWKFAGSDHWDPYFVVAPVDRDGDAMIRAIVELPAE